MNLEMKSQIVKLCYGKNKFNFEINLIGKIQLKNVLMALIAAEKSGIKFQN